MSPRRNYDSPADGERLQVQIALPLKPTIELVKAVRTVLQPGSFPSVDMLTW